MSSVKTEKLKKQIQHKPEKRPDKHFYSAEVETKKFKVIGTRPLRPDGIDKVTGKANFGADIALNGMLFGAVLRSNLAHAKIKKINVVKALKLKGVKGVMTHEDLAPITFTVSNFFAPSPSTTICFARFKQSLCKAFSNSWSLGSNIL